MRNEEWRILHSDFFILHSAFSIPHYPTAPCIIRPVIRLATSHFLHHVTSIQARPIASHREKGFGRRPSGGGRRFLCTAITQLARQPACVHAADAGHAVLSQPIGKRARGAPVRTDWT